MFNWLDYFDLAHELLHHEGEAYRRSAVSRAYYALFCDARNTLVVSWEWNPPEDESHHAYLWNTFAAHQDRKRKRIGELGHRLRRYRNKVDYDDRIDDLSDVIEFAMINAENLKTALQNL